MSHFSVLVVGPDVKAQLAPFQENNMGDCPAEFLAFHDTEDEYRKEYEKDAREMIVMQDGSLRSPYDECFRRPFDRADPLGPQYAYPEGTTTRDVPHREVYPTFEAFMADWAGAKLDAAKGRYGYWENPNAKWDWYQVGGRYSGRLKAKVGAAVVDGERSWCNPGENKDGWGDTARKADIDWEGMMKPRGEHAARYYDLAAPIIAQHPILRSWDSIRDDDSLGGIDAKRAIYHAQAVLKPLREAKLDDWDDGYEPALYLMPRDKFIERARLNAVTFFAFLHNGKWAERGKMGWWATVTDEKSDWEDQLAALLAQVRDDEIVTVVDCHI